MRSTVAWGLNNTVREGTRAGLHVYILLKSPDINLQIRIDVSEIAQM